MISGWGELALTDEVRAERTSSPRSLGVTMVIDTGLGLAATRDTLEMSGAWIDHWKLSFGTSVFVPEPVLREKLEAIAQRDILTFPGGTLFEAAIVRHHCRVFMAKVRELGFTAVEVSDGTIDLPADRRKRVIECARDAGLTVISEVGKKDPDQQPPADALAEQACLDLEWGSSWVVVEGRESGKGVGVFDAGGGIDMSAVDTIAGCAGHASDRLVWEAPIKDQQVALIGRFGLNVSLGNIDPTRVLALEALRSGLRFETLKPIADALRISGDWQPDQPEPPSPLLS
ncbi:MAG: phosphosulfolactate synthase [Acidimicrobiia bacterium]